MCGCGGCGGEWGSVGDVAVVVVVVKEAASQMLCKGCGATHACFSSWEEGRYSTAPCKHCAGSAAAVAQHPTNNLE